jgi:N-acetylglucosamine malate deacetylase 1
MKLDLLAIGAHPDDVEMSCGGTISKMVKSGYKTGVIDLTRGEMGTRGTPELRGKETRNATKILGVHVRLNLGLPDGNISVQSNLELIEIIRQHRPAIVMLPYMEDRHPDHVHASHLIVESCFKAGLEKVRTSSLPFRPRWLIHYMQHYEFQPVFVVDISENFKIKMKAVKAYQSQLHNPSYQKVRKERETLISSPGFMRLLETRGRYYGSLIGADYGEPFWIKGMIGINNPVEFFNSQSNFRTL